MQANTTAHASLPAAPEIQEQLQRLSISKVSDKGVFSLETEGDFFYFEDLRELLIEEPENRTSALNVTAVFQFDEVDENDFVKITYGWEVRNVTRNTIEIQLLFTEPLLVSSDYPIEHSVKVSINDSLYFVSETGKMINPLDR